MRIYPILWSLIICLIFVSCVNEFDPKLESSERRLVVEAQLTTKLGFQYVYLSYDASYNATSSIFEFDVVGARVVVKDDIGNEYPFFDDPIQNNFINTRSGYNYRSVKEFKLEIGRTYQLFVETSDNKSYVSTPEKVLEVPKVARVDIDFEEVSLSSVQNGKYNVSINIKDKSGEPNFYKWDWYHVTTIDYCREFRPNGSLVTFLDRCCQTCYEIIPCVDCLELGNDRLIDGNTFNKKIAEVPYVNFTNYYMVINQYSVSENAYKFWNAIRQQTKNSGGLFDTVPESVRSNVRNIADENEEVLGYFTVSDLHEEIVIVDRNRFSPKPFIVLKFQPPVFQVTNDCFPCEEKFNRTKTKPRGWR